MNRLFHITSADEFDRARPASEYRPQAFDREGFVHCSYGRQVVATANRIFAGRSGLVLLEIDAERVPSRIVDENLEGGSELYPHIYGPIPLAAVVAVHPLPCGADGRFAMPATSSAV